MYNRMALVSEESYNANNMTKEIMDEAISPLHEINSRFKSRGVIFRHVFKKNNARAVQKIYDPRNFYVTNPLLTIRGT